jgi:bifunctional non-homologous end joining protein LigD
MPGRRKLGEYNRKRHFETTPESARAAMPERLVPMLAGAGGLPDDDDAWAYEVKWDGVRAIAYWQPGRWLLESRNLNDITPRYPELHALSGALGSHEVILDGEIVAFDEQGHPSFALLQHRMHLVSDTAIRTLARDAPVSYVVFDLLYLDGHDTMALPYRDRRALLDQLGLVGPAWQTPAYHQGDGRALLEATRENHLEGVVAKRLDSPYRPGKRTGDWVKVKSINRQEFVVGGWLPGKGNRAQRLGALLVGYHQREENGPDTLRYAGRVGTGFDERELQRVGEELTRRERSSSPFSGVQPPREARFVDPELVAEVEFSQWTRDGMLRHSSYQGLRDDKDATDVVREPAARGVPYEVRHETKRAMEIEVDGRVLKLSNRAKVMYPRSGFTKGELIDYYAAVAPVLLPHLAGRPLTLKRYPQGVEGPHFYEKRCPSHRPDWVTTAAVWTARIKEEIDYCLAEDLPTLIWAANLADIELHTSLSRANDMDTPTAMVFDLDPGTPPDRPDVGLRACCRVALWVRELFDSLGLRSLVKTSGSKGLQVYVPLNTPVSYEQTKPFARAVAELLEKTHPRQVVSRMAKQLRAGKVLIDWSQNDRHKTTVCVYSLRARQRPTISTPLAWEEVEQAIRGRLALSLSAEPATLLERVERHGDLFEPLLRLTQELPDLAAGRGVPPPDPSEVAPGPARGFESSAGSGSPSGPRNRLGKGGSSVPPRGVKKGSKRERQYEHVKQSEKDQGASESRAEEIAARTVNKERARSGESRTRSRASTNDISSGRRGGLRSGRSGPRGRTREQLYQEAQKLNIPGRSAMNKEQLRRAVDARK